MQFDKESLTPAQSHRQSVDSGTSQPPGANVPSFCSPGGRAARRPHHTLGRHGVQGAQGGHLGLLPPFQDTLKGHLLAEPQASCLEV